ncbi:WD40-repeat-containing domain protein [Zychaea mexicana]|uniref:WD40-repeat-containing domain protein n=1 Tax=Zychaea mexicana TaxID=64656 RepID=UPI0022FE1984|nr:WD40-repeat-containing domain protein [Zychaea mexicana]KAI9488536.1 WD40-repeat-containing domain protein [Zychaea mexicana]
MVTESKKRSRTDQETTTEKPVKKQVLEGGSVLDSILLPNKAHAADSEDFRIVTGTYERILYGINAYWKKAESTTTTTTPKLRLEPIFIVPAHTGCIRTVAIGGQFLASGSTDEVIRLYDVKKRKEYGSLGGQHRGDVTDIQFYGKYMLSASDDKTICIWRKSDWEYLKTLKGHKGRVNSVAIHPSGKIALSVSSDKTVIVWNLMTARKASMNKLYQEGLCVLWNKTGDKYAIMFDRQIKIYNVADAEVTSTISHRSRFLCMRYYTSNSDNKEYIISGHEDKTIRIWDASTGELATELAGHKLRVKTITIIEPTLPNSSGEEKDKAVTVLVSVSSDGVIKCWDVEAGLAKKEEQEVLLGEYDTKSRATCCTAHVGFSKAVVQQQQEQRSSKGDKKKKREEEEEEEEEKASEDSE